MFDLSTLELTGTISQLGTAFEMMYCIVCQGNALYYDYLQAYKNESKGYIAAQGKYAFVVSSLTFIDLNSDISSSSSNHKCNYQFISQYEHVTLHGYDISLTNVKIVFEKQ